MAEDNLTELINTLSETNDSMRRDILMFNETVVELMDRVERLEKLMDAAFTIAAKPPRTPGQEIQTAIAKMEKQNG